MSGNAVVLDDTLLTLHLAGRDPWRPDGAQVATTASWWFRLARATMGHGGGSLSGLISRFDEGDRLLVEDAMRHLPRGIVVLHPRDTVPQAAALSSAHGLNLLAADALATALVLRAPILVDMRDVGPRLRAVAAHMGVEFEVVEP